MMGLHWEKGEGFLVVLDCEEKAREEGKEEREKDKEMEDPKVQTIIQKY